MYLGECIHTYHENKAARKVVEWLVQSSGLDLVMNCISLGVNVTLKNEMHSFEKISAFRFRNIQFPDYIGSLIDHMLYKPQNARDVEHYPKLPTKCGVGFTRAQIVPLVDDFSMWDNLFQSDIKGFDAGVAGTSIIRDAMRRSFLCNSGSNGWKLMGNRRVQGIENRYADRGLYIVRSLIMMKSVLVMPMGDVVQRTFEGQVFSGWANTSSTDGYVRVESSALALWNPFQKQASLGDDDVEELKMDMSDDKLHEICKSGGLFTQALESLGHTVKREPAPKFHIVKVVDCYGQLPEGEESISWLSSRFGYLPGANAIREPYWHLDNLEKSIMTFVAKVSSAGIRIALDDSNMMNDYRLHSRFEEIKSFIEFAEQYASRQSGFSVDESMKYGFNDNGFWVYKDTVSGGEPIVVREPNKVMMTKEELCRMADEENMQYDEPLELSVLTPQQIVKEEAIAGLNRLRLLAQYAGAPSLN
jgi:hypothetical protein